MRRRRPPARERLHAVATAATEIFGRLGYRGTRTADVAARAGMSSGSIFTYVESKEALFHLVFLLGFGYLDHSTPPLPVATPAEGETVALIERHLRAVPEPCMHAALRADHPADAGAEVRDILRERYAIVAGLWPMLAVIERCAVELPELEALYFGRARAAHFERLLCYLKKRADDGDLRPWPDPAVAARLVTETMAWFAWKRHEGRDARLYDDDLVQRTVVEFLAAGLLAPGGS
jgi:AcrR family transcriptional regulator